MAPLSCIIISILTFLILMNLMKLKIIEMQENKNQTDHAVHSVNKLLTGLFTNRESVDNAYLLLHEKGYTNDEINIIMSDETRAKYFPHDTDENSIGDKVLEGAGKGAAIGGTIGTITGIVAALATSFVIPGLGILIAGPIAAALAGAGTGIVTGGIIGSLMGAEISEEQAKLYTSEVKNGHILLAIHPKNEDDATYFEKSWRVNRDEGLYKQNIHDETTG